MVIRSLALSLCIACPAAAFQGAQLSIAEELELPRPPGNPGNFGRAVDVDGDVAVATFGYGIDWRVYVYGRAAGVWSFAAELVPSSPIESFASSFPVAVAGEVIAVGSPGAGAVHMFRRGGGAWTETDVLQASDATPASLFGYALDLDGDRLLVGDYNVGGGAYVFLRTPTSWVEEQKLTGSLQQDLFGVSVALRGDLALVGATANDWGGFDSPGAAWLFRNGAGGWAEIGVLRAETLPQDDAYFGWACALGEERAVVAAWGSETSPNSSGALYVFEPLPSGDWRETARLARPGVTMLGWDVALEETVLVGAARNDAFGGNWGTGTAQVFRCDEDGWRFDAQIVSSETSPGHGFGQALALDGGRAFIGAATDPAVAGPSGACYAYTIARAFVGAPACGASANSAGAGASLRAHGSDVAGDDALTVEVSGLPPGELGYLLAGETFSVTNPAGAQGTLCIGNPLARFTDVVLAADPAGRACRDVPLTQVPTSPASTVLAGETWYFQWWFRDLNPGPTSNFSSAAGIAFQ